MKNNFELIPLLVEAKGEVLSSNLDLFRASVTEALTYINRELVSDDDFDQADEDVKCLKNAENVVKEAKEKALQDAEELNTLFKALDESSEEVRKVRLELENLIKSRKETRRKELIQEARERLICADHLKDSVFIGIFDSTIKGKRSMDSLKKALDIAVATGNAIITGSRKVIADYVAKHGVDIVPDKDELEVRDCKIVESELRRRVEARAAAAEKKRLEEEAAKAKAELAEARLKQSGSIDQSLPKGVTDDGIPFGNMGARVERGGSPFEEAFSGTVISAPEEWAKFVKAVRECFGMLKPAKEGLVHEANKQRAARFADAVGVAWKNVNMEGAK